MSRAFKYYHEAVGFNYRMTNLQAAVGIAQLEDIDNKLKWREELEQKYKEILKNIDYIHFQRDDLENRKKITWLITVYTDTEERRNEILRKMKEQSIDARPFFVPLSHMEIYKKYIFSNDVSSKISKLGFNLPTLKKLDRTGMQRVKEALL